VRRARKPITASSGSHTGFFANAKAVVGHATPAVQRSDSEDRTTLWGLQAAARLVGVNRKVLDQSAPDSRAR